MYLPRLDGTYPIDGQPQFQNHPFRDNIVALPADNGYFIVSPYGNVVSRGLAKEPCNRVLSSCSNFPANPDSEQLIVGVAATPTGAGLRAVSRHGSE